MSTEIDRAVEESPEELSLENVESPSGPCKVPSKRPRQPLSEAKSPLSKRHRNSARANLRLRTPPTPLSKRARTANTPKQSATRQKRTRAEDEIAVTPEDTENTRKKAVTDENASSVLQEWVTKDNICVGDRTEPTRATDNDQVEEEWEPSSDACCDGIWNSLSPAQFEAPSDGDWWTATMTSSGRIEPVH